MKDDFSFSAHISHADYNEQNLEVKIAYVPYVSDAIMKTFAIKECYILHPTFRYYQTMSML